MTAALEWVSGQQHALATLYPQERPGTHCSGGWVGPRVGLDRCEKSRPTGIRSPDRPARSQSLYRLSYRAHRISLYGGINVFMVVYLFLCIYLYKAWRWPQHVTDFFLAVPWPRGFQEVKVPRFLDNGTEWW
jgi:hypothetical protein